MKKIFYLLLAAISLTACDNGNDAPATITGYDHALLKQTLYADQTSGAGDFTFTTTESWTTQITDITPKQRATGSDIWVTLDPSHGGAGTVTMKIILTPNLTGADRKATIRIVCGGTTITITVEQKGTTESGEKPGDPDPVPGKYITRIDVEDDYTDDYSGTEYITFRYDEEMLAEMVTTETESYKGVLQHTWVTTTSIGQISGTGTPSIGFTTEERVDGGSPRLLTDRVAQFENGRVTSCSGSGTDYDKTETGEPWSDSFKMIYDANGYLVRTERQESNVPGDNYVLTWSGGNYTKVAWGDGYVDEAVYANSAYKNKANLDLNAFIVLDSEGFDFSFGEPEKILALCGYTGNRSANLATKVTDTWHRGNPTTYTYEFDADGYPVRICARYVSSNSETTYKITYNK